jgi:hypothetical protein
MNKNLTKIFAEMAQTSVAFVACVAIGKFTALFLG